MRKLDGKARQTVAKALKVGLPMTRTAELAGVHRTTLWRWLETDPALIAARDRRTAALAAIQGAR